MELLTYDEINPELVTVLNKIGLNYNISPHQISKVRDIEKRLPEEFAWYLVDDKNQIPVAQCSYLTISVRTGIGKLDLCIPQMICILPKYANKGIATQLMNEVHEIAQARGLNHFLLTTSKSLGAVRFYKKLGYSILKQISTVYGYLPPYKNNDITIRTIKPGDYNIVIDTFNAIHENDFGFVYRPIDLPKIRELWGDLSADNLYLLEDNHDVLGYIWATGENYLDLKEISLVRRYFDGVAKFCGNKYFYSSDVDLKKFPEYLRNSFSTILTWTVVLIKSFSKPYLKDLLDNNDFYTPFMDLY